MAIGSVNVPGVVLNVTHQSTGITGTSTAAAVFSDSGIALAAPGDTCINPTTGNVYKCVAGGAPSAAQWVYTGCIKGPIGTTGGTGTRGSQIYCGTAITGTSTTGTVFSGSGISSALVNDLYLNTSTWNMYRCTTAGAASAAKWVYVGNIKGVQGNSGTNGSAGANATINGVNALTIKTGDGLSLTQSGGTATISLNSEAKAAVEALKKELGGKLPSANIGDNTHEVIQKVAAAGLGAAFWNIGDSTAVYISGTVGSLSINGAFRVFIIGFNHNSGVEGLGIHFQFGKDSNGKDLAFCDDKYNTTGSDAAFRMNTTNTNAGGWASSYMRNTICPAFLAALPESWRKIIAPCTKYTDNVGGGNGSVAANITATVDKIFLLSEQEVFGTITNGNTYEANYQKQYEYYANGNSRVKYRHNSTTTACYWWLRSVNATYTDYFRSVSTGGSVSSYSAYYSIGFAPGFKVA